MPAGSSYAILTIEGTGSSAQAFTTQAALYVNDVLAASMAPAPGTDSFSNAYVEGVAGYQVVPTGVFAGTHAVALTETSGILLGGNWPAVTFTNETSIPFAPPFIGGQSSAGSGCEIVLASGEDTSGDVQAYLYLASQHAGAVVTNGAASLQAGLTGIGPNNTLQIDDNTFTVTLTGSAVLVGQSAPSQVSGDAVTYATTNGALAYVNGLDGNVYLCGESLVRTTGSVTINSTSPQTIVSIPVGAAKYRVHVLIDYIGGQNAGIAEISWGGTATYSNSMGRGVWSGPSGYGLAFHADNVNTAPGNENGPTLTTGTFCFEWDGVITFSAGGTMILAGNEGTNGDTWTVATNSFIEIHPLS